MLLHQEVFECVPRIELAFTVSESQSDLAAA